MIGIHSKVFRGINKYKNFNPITPKEMAEIIGYNNILKNFKSDIRNKIVDFKTQWIWNNYLKKKLNSSKNFDRVIINDEIANQFINLVLLQETSLKFINIKDLITNSNFLSLNIKEFTSFQKELIIKESKDLILEKNNKLSKKSSDYEINKQKWIHLLILFSLTSVFLGMTLGYKLQKRRPNNNLWFFDRLFNWYYIILIFLILIVGPSIEIIPKLLTE